MLIQINKGKTTWRVCFNVNSAQFSYTLFVGMYERKKVNTCTKLEFPVYLLLNIIRSDFSYWLVFTVEGAERQKKNKKSYLKNNSSFHVNVNVCKSQTYSIKKLYLNLHYVWGWFCSLDIKRMDALKRSNRDINSFSSSMSATYSTFLRLLNSQWHYMTVRTQLTVSPPEYDV